MGIQKNVGKNTIGDNQKMSVSLHNYQMSTHDLSTIVRNTQSPGTLVPNLCLVGQKGDTFDIDIDANVLTHPTTGPLFGSFKLEHHVYTAPARLYNSWLHNNRTKIGLNMAQVKLPQITVTLNASYDNATTEDKQWVQVNPSCLLAYLGIRGYANLSGVATKTTTKNALPILAYYDIFKNFYANTQEDNFYIIGAALQLNKISRVTPAGNEALIPLQSTYIMEDGLQYRINDVSDDKLDYIEVRWQASNGGPANTTKLSEIVDEIQVSGTTATFTAITKQATGAEYIRIYSIQSNESTALKEIPLENLDTIRDKILMTAGDTVFDIGSQTTSVEPFNSFTKRLTETNKLYSTIPQFGLCLKTYNSDQFQNWINTEWIDGVEGINEASAVDVSNGTLSMDALNLSQKVYNFLNRIAVSGGTYRDWLETVYTGGNYMERCETPMFEGGVSQEIVFQEVVSNSASENEPLGTLAGRGVTTGRQKGGHIRIKVTEPCYIMSICSITPRIDYGQGNTWDTYLETMDDWHKPALDGIGYQDSTNGERAWWTDYYTADADLKRTSAGKTVAWLNYMTNVNKTFGNFAPGMSESFMVLNRNYSMNNADEPQIEDLTTYIDPVKFNYIFADANLDAMNFWVQTRFDIKVRRLISAKQIPNL